MKGQKLCLQVSNRLGDVTSRRTSHGYQLPTLAMNARSSVTSREHLSYLLDDHISVHLIALPDMFWYFDCEPISTCLTPTPSKHTCIFREVLCHITIFGSTAL